MAAYTPPDSKAKRRGVLSQLIAQRGAPGGPSTTATPTASITSSRGPSIPPSMTTSRTGSDALTPGDKPDRSTSLDPGFLRNPQSPGPVGHFTPKPNLRSQGTVGSLGDLSKGGGNGNAKGNPQPGEKGFYNMTHRKGEPIAGMLAKLKQRRRGGPSTRVGNSGPSYTP